MRKPLSIKFYPKKEEELNVISHGLGLLLSFIGSILLILKAAGFEDKKMIVSFGIYGFSLVLLYSASTLYHSSKSLRNRFRLKIFDHIAIFILIAGTYTPFSMVTLEGKIGWIVFGTAWGIAFFGTVLKIFFTGKYKILSTLLYVGMGWIIIFAINPLLENLPNEGIWWLFGGGLAYTIGAILYNINRIPFNHAIFHVFVLLGSLCHFMAIYLYVSP